VFPHLGSFLSPTISVVPWGEKGKGGRKRGEKGEKEKRIKNEPFNDVGFESAFPISKEETKRKKGEEKGEGTKVLVTHAKSNDTLKKGKKGEGNPKGSVNSLLGGSTFHSCMMPAMGGGKKKKGEGEGG